MTTQFICPQQ